MSDKRQKMQLELALEPKTEGEPRRSALQGTESLTANSETEGPANAGRMEEICKAENLRKALDRVRSNKGSPGVDGMTVDELLDYLRSSWPKLKEQLLRGTYKPQPVLRKEILKPGGGMRKLGIPTVVDRFIQQAVMQVLQEHWDPQFSAYSYGFRPGRSAHKAVSQAQKYIAEGNRYVVDIDLEKFFDRVNHDRLMSRLAMQEKDKRLLKLIRGFLNAGVLENGLVSPNTEGTPQGGPLSPLLSNIVLDELDRELERRGHRFCRYADDCNIYVGSERAGQRVMQSIGRFITNKLKLKVNDSKSAVSRPQKRKFLGFSFTGGREIKRRFAPASLQRFKERVRELTRRSRGVNLEGAIEELNRYLQGWSGYYGYVQTPSVMRGLDSWIRRRLRQLAWAQWKTGRRRFQALRKLGVSPELAKSTAGSNHGPWRVSLSPGLHRGLSDAYFRSLELVSLHARLYA